MRRLNFLDLTQAVLTINSIISYMTKQQLPSVSILTPDSLEEFKTADKVVLIAYLASERQNIQHDIRGGG